MEITQNHTQQNTITIFTFGFQNTDVNEIIDIIGRKDSIIDCRILPDPCVYIMLGMLDEEDIIKWLLKVATTTVIQLLCESKNLIINGHNTIAFGCFGGKHRSVSLARAFKQIVNNLYPQYIVNIIQK